MADDAVDGNNSDSYVDSLDAAREDALFSFNEHIRAFEEEAAKGGRIAQLDGLILTVFVSILAASNVDIVTFWNWWIVGGLGLLLLGFGLGMLGQFSLDVAVGVSEVGLEGILDRKSGEVEYM